MSAPVASSSSSSVRTVSNNININRVEPSGKKQRVVRRRGRGNLGIDSDEEIEREVRSDSEEEEEEAYSSDSSTDSDTEPASDLPHDHPTALTPNTSQSPEHVDPFFAKSGDWADDAVEEQGLPVIDFNDLRQKISPSTPRRPPGQTARQAYQQRLEADPSYVPTVGEFWGHDDRLLDKDLRSLSGWWRGRWQGGLRGRGGRGRGRSFPPREPLHAESETPVNREWTHDGFEELKQNENRRPSVRGRGSFTPSFKPPGRVWFTKKPEHTWTKQAESFLYFDPSSRPRPGNPATVRVKLPTQKTPAVRVPIQASNLKHPDLSSPSSSSTTASGSDYGDRIVVVRLPKAAPVVEEPSLEEVFTVRPRLVSPNPIPLPDNAISSSHAVSSSISSIDPAVQQKLEQVSLEPQKSDPVRWIQTEEAVLRHPTGVVLDEKQPQQQQLSTFQSPPPQSQGSPAYGSPYMYAPPPLPIPLPPGVAVDPTGMTYEVATGRPVYLPPPMNMSMYGSPPPSMMHLHHPVPNTSFDFIPAPTHPHHHRHRSTVSSSDFIPAGTTPIPINGYSMEYGTPMPISTPPTSLFSFPRQSSRIQIRAPGEPPASSEVETQEQQSQNSAPEPKLRSNAAAFTPSSQFFPSSSVSMSETQQQQEQEEAAYHPDAEVDHNAESIPQAQGGSGSGMIGYIPYAHNPYHYHTPEPYGVGSGYNPYDYVDMSQVAPYEMYPPPPPPQGTVYYH